MKDNLHISHKKTPNMPDYDSFCSQFSWEHEKDNLNGLPDGGINIAHEAVERHADGENKKTIALI